MSALTDLVEKLIAAQTPGSTEKFVRGVMFETTHEFALRVLQIDPPLSNSDVPDEWLTQGQWVDHHMAIVAGTLARMHAMPGKPWTNPAAAEIQAALYVAGCQRGRELYAASASANTGYNRVMGNIRAAVPDMRDPSIHHELFNTIDEFRRNVLQDDPPDPTAAPTAWLSNDDYSTFFRAIMAGTLSKIYAQSKKPWSDPGAASYQLALYQQETATARSDKADADAAEPSDRLLTNIRSTIPGVKDPTLKQELFNAVDEACRKAFVWVETIPVTLTLGVKHFVIPTDGAEIVRAVSVTHPTAMNTFSFDNGTFYYEGDVTADVVAHPAIVVAALAPKITRNLDDPDNWIPSDLWGQCHELFLTGALWRLLIQPNKSYTDTKLAQFYGQRNRRLLAEAAQARRAGGLMPPRDTFFYPRFAV